MHLDLHAANHTATEVPTQNPSFQAQSLAFVALSYALKTAGYGLRFSQTKQIPKDLERAHPSKGSSQYVNQTNALAEAPATTTSYKQVMQSSLVQRPIHASTIHLDF